MGWFIKNLSLDMYRCNTRKLIDKEFTLQLVKDLTDELDMKPCLGPKVEESSLGLTGGIGLMTSHAVLNNFSAGRSSFIVISTCKDFNHDEIIKYLLEKFDGKNYEAMLMQYDIPKGPHIELFHKTEKMTPLREKYSTITDVKKDGVPIYQAFGYHLSLLKTLGEQGERVLLKWFMKKAKSVKVSRRVYQFQPIGETGAFQYNGFSSFHHTWPEYGFIMRHTQTFETPTFLDNFSYAYHGPNSGGISAEAHQVGDKTYAYVNLPERR